MPTIPSLRRFPRLAVLTLVTAACLLVSALSAAPGDSKRPTLKLKASASVAFAPARIVFTAELKGGADDYEDFYCPTVVWKWDDGTESESTADCEPYQPGTSAIKRRYVVEHVFKYGGAYRVRFVLKRREKVQGDAVAVVQVRPGLQGATSR